MRNFTLLFVICAFVFVVFAENCSAARTAWGPIRITPSNFFGKQKHAVKQKQSRIGSVSDATALSSRGGACEDSTPALMAKVALSTAFETGAMMLVIKIGKWLSSKTKNWPKVLGVSIPEVLSTASIIFASSVFGSIIDGGLSAASNQVLKPTVTPGDPNWYTNLKRPKWEPPGIAFPIMWLIVSKPTQLIAVTKVLQSGPTPWKILGPYCAHLALGDAWNKVFFGMQCPGRGAAVITTFYGALLYSTYLFSTIDAAAGKFMLPTCGWVTVATALNWNIYLANK